MLAGAAGEGRRAPERNKLPMERAECVSARRFAQAAPQGRAIRGRMARPDSTGCIQGKRDGSRQKQDRDQ